MAGPIFITPPELGLPKKSGQKPRVDLLPEDFDELVQDQGCRVRISPSMLCPNRTTLHDTNHKLDCPLCFGDEALDLPEESQEGFAFIQAIKLDKQFNVEGIFDMKDAMMSPETKLKVYEWYKVEVLDFSSIYNQLIKKSSANEDKLRYSPATKVLDGDYFLVDNEGNRYTNGNEYYVSDRNIVWKNATRPDPGTLFTITYPILPTFRIIQMLHDNRYYYYTNKIPVKRPVRMPQQAIIRWDYLSFKSGSNELPVSP